MGGGVTIEAVWPGFWESASLEGATDLKWQNVRHKKVAERCRQYMISVTPFQSLPVTRHDKAIQGQFFLPCSCCRNIGNQTASDGCNLQPGINSHRVGKRKSEKRWTSTAIWNTEHFTPLDTNGWNPETDVHKKPLLGGPFSGSTLFVGSIRTFNQQLRRVRG